MFAEAIFRGALVSARLCRLPEQEVHQPSKKRSKEEPHTDVRFSQIRWVRGNNNGLSGLIGIPYSKKKSV